MTREEARIIVLEAALDQARNTIVFLDACLRTPQFFKYSYPEQTETMLREIYALVDPPDIYCVHSVHRPDCTSCINHVDYMNKLHEAKGVLAGGLLS